MATSKDYSRSVIGGSDEVADIFCEPCGQDGKQTEAEGFCVDCSEYLCGQCYKSHKLSKAFRNHVLQDKENMPINVAEAGVKDPCTKKCDLHTDKVIEYFCRSCDKIGCTTCITLDHRQCEKVDHVPKIVKAPNIGQEVQTFIKKVDLISKEVKERKNTLTSMSNTTDKIRKMAKTELKNQRAEINKFFDDLEKEMNNKIDEIHTSNTAVVTATSMTYDTMDRDLEDFKTDISTKQKTGHHCEAFIAMKHSATGVDAIEKQFQNMKMESKIVKYKLFPSSEIQNMKRKMTEICRLETETVLMDTSVTPAAGTQQLPIKTPPSKKLDTAKKSSKRPDISNLKTLRLNTEINVSTSNDTKIPYVRGLTVIHDHYIVVADINNQSVKVVDSRNKKVISDMKMGKAVWNVTHIKDDRIAVALKLKIQFLSVSKAGKLTKESDIDTEQTCFDVVYNNGNLIVAQGLKVRIIAMEGSILKTFEMNSEHERLFMSCYGLVISNDNKTIYASDHAKNTVTSLTMDGHVKHIYTDNDLKGPWGISVDKEDNIYVCSTATSSCIHQVSADCTKLQVFTDMFGGSVTCTNTNKLIVGVDVYESIRIYDIL